jgi:dolichyl-phosphate beta-glucosyltransferase
MTKLTVVIPAYNEATRLGKHLSGVMEYLAKNYPGYELILVDDGSSDNTAKIISTAIRNNSRAKLISYTPNRGKGFAVKTGVLASHGDIVLFMDADLSTPLSEIPRILKMLDGTDIVIGSRGKTDSKISKRPPLYRQLASTLFDQIKFTMVGLREFSDTQCGFKVFRGDVARKLFGQSQIDRFMFDAEILFLAQRAKYKIREMPVSWADAPGSHVRFWEGIVNMFRDLWRIRYMNKYEKI